MHLTVTTIARIDRPGRYSAECHGLALVVRTSSRGKTRSWVQRVRIDDKPTNVGLGPYPLVSVKQAREFAMANALAVLKREPLPYGRRRQPESRRIPTVADAFEKVIEMRRPTWSGRKMEHDWRASFERHVLPSIGNRKVDGVDTAAVLDVLTPIWQTKRAAARSVRSRLSYSWSGHVRMDSSPTTLATRASMARWRRTDTRPRTARRSTMPTCRPRTVQSRTSRVVSAARRSLSCYHPDGCEARRSTARAMGGDRLCDGHLGRSRPRASKHEWSTACR